MAFLDSSGANTLEEILGQQADSASNTISQQYAKKRRQSVAQQARQGRLTSGVANYQAGDINAAEAGDLGEVENALAMALADVPLDDYASTQDDARKRQLAELIGKLNKRESNPLLGALGGASQGAAAGSAFGPYGAAIGGIGGGFLGLYGES